MYLISYLKGYSFMVKKFYQNPPPGNSYIFTLFFATKYYCKTDISKFFVSVHQSITQRRHQALSMRCPCATL